jgi:poly(3-hydroxybutyrate) depolymerase
MGHLQYAAAVIAGLERDLMSFGKIATPVPLLRVHHEKDPDGFAISRDEVLARVRAYKEDRHGSVRWANRAAFSEATALFRFRVIPGVAVEPLLIIVCGLKRYEILSAEVIRNMYVEVLCKEVVAVGKL